MTEQVDAGGNGAHGNDGTSGTDGADGVSYKHRKPSRCRNNTTNRSC